MDPDERLRLAQLLDFQVNNPWSRFQDDPVAFVEVGLGETLWTKQKQILESVRDNKRTVIPSAHGIGKTLRQGLSLGGARAILRELLG
jgi:hypothetical protein